MRDIKPEQIAVGCSILAKDSRHCNKTFRKALVRKGPRRMKKPISLTNALGSQENHVDREKF